MVGFGGRPVVRNRGVDIPLTFEGEGVPFAEGDAPLDTGNGKDGTVDA